MDAIEINASLEKRQSKKTGKYYYVVLIKLTDSYEKFVFLNNAELELLRFQFSDEYEFLEVSN